jgi:hypothetical protein
MYNQAKGDRLDGSRTGSAPGQSAGHRKGRSSTIKTGRSGMKSPRSLSPDQSRTTNVDELEQQILTVSPINTHSKFEIFSAAESVENKRSTNNYDMTLPSLKEWVGNHNDSSILSINPHMPSERGQTYSPFDDEIGDFDFELPVNGKQANVKEGGARESVTGAILYI